MKLAHAWMVLVVGLAPALAQETKEEAPSVAGTWTIQAIEAPGGVKLEGDLLKGASMAFADGKVTMKVVGQTVAAAFKITPGKPHFMDIIPSEGPQKDKTSKCIFELSGKDKDEIKMCVAEPDVERPKEFKATIEGKTTIIYLKREEKK